MSVTSKNTCNTQYNILTILLYSNDVFSYFFRTVPDAYSESLIADGVLSQDEVSKIVSEHTEWLTDHFKQIETFKPGTSKTRLINGGVLINQYFNCQNLNTRYRNLITMIFLFLIFNIFSI